MSKITEFYKGEALDHHGRNLQEIQNWDNARLEEVFSYIQWLFPLNEESNYNSLAPILTSDDILELRNSELIRENLVKSFRVMLSFYGFDLAVNDKKIIINKSNAFEDRSRNWLTEHNHNFLRITRILKCLMLAKLDDYAIAFLDALTELYNTDSKNIIGAVSYSHWESAVKKHKAVANIHQSEKPMKIVFCALPMLRDPIKAQGRVEGNSQIQYDGEVFFAANAVLARTLKKDDRVKIVLLMTHDEDENYKRYIQMFKDEFKEINKDIGAEVIGHIYVEMPFVETKEMFSDALRKIIANFKDNAEVIADVTFGPKLLPVILFYALRFSENFFNTDIKYIVYRKIDFRKENSTIGFMPPPPVIFDVTSFYYLNSLSEVMECENSIDAINMLDALLDL